MNKSNAYQREVLKPLIFASWLAYAKGGQKFDPAPFLMDAVVPIEWAGFGVWKRDRKWETNDPEIMSVVLADPIARTAIVAFRGACLQPDLPNCGNNLCSHEMFDTQMKAEYLKDYQCSPMEFGAVVRRTERYVEKLRRSLGKTYKYIVTGHSIGGALAMSLDKEWLQVIGFDPAPYWMLGPAQAPVFSTRLWNRIAILQPLTVDEQQLYRNPERKAPKCPEDAHTCAVPVLQPPQSCLRCHDQIKAGKKSERQFDFNPVGSMEEEARGIHDMAWARECINDPKYFNERYGMSKCKHDLAFISRFAEIVQHDLGTFTCEVVCSLKKPSIERDHPIQLGIENAASDVGRLKSPGAEPGIDGESVPTLQVLKDGLSESIGGKLRDMTTEQATQWAEQLKSGSALKPSTEGSGAKSVSMAGQMKQHGFGGLTAMAGAMAADEDESLEAAVVKKAKKVVEEKADDTKKAGQLFQAKTKIAKADRKSDVGDGALSKFRGMFSRGVKNGNVAAAFKSMPKFEKAAT